MVLLFENAYWSIQQTTSDTRLWPRSTSQSYPMYHHKCTRKILFCLKQQNQWQRTSPQLYWVRGELYWWYNQNLNGFPACSHETCTVCTTSRHCLVCTNASSGELVSWQETISLNKLFMEGIAKEEQTVLVWLINTRVLLLSLQFDTFKAWTNDVAKVVEDSNIMVEDIDSLIGRLNHESYVIPVSR